MKIPDANAFSAFSYWKCDLEAEGRVVQPSYEVENDHFVWVFLAEYFVFKN